MKRALPLLLALVVVVALLGTMYALKTAPAPEAPAPTATPAPVVTLQVLVDQEASPAVEVTLETGGEATTYVYDAQQQLYKAKGYDDRLPFDQVALGNLFGSCSRLVSRKVVDEQPQDLSTYGLDNPTAIITAKYGDGASHVIRLGAASPLEDGYFGQLDDSPSVQLLLGYDADLFTQKLFDFRTYSLFHPLGDDAEEYALTVRELAFDLGGEGELAFHRGPDGAGDVPPTIEITRPVEVLGDEYAFYQKVITPLFSLKNARLQLVEDLPQDLARYGLDVPNTLWLKDDGGSTRLLIGSENEEGRTYLMREDVPAVLSVKSSALSFLKLDYSVVMDRLVWLFNIAEANTLTVELNGNRQVLEIVDKGAAFRLNGADIAADLGRALYRSAISLQYDDRTEESALDTPPVCTLTFAMHNGDTHTLSLHALNERHLEVVRDGESTGFYVNKSALEQISAALDALNH